MTTIKITNLTPHKIDVVWEDGEIRRSYPSEGTATVAETETAPATVDGVPTCVKKYGTINGLPEPADDVYYVVALPVALAAWEQGREDVLTVGKTLRSDDRSTILGCLGFIRRS